MVTHGIKDKVAVIGCDATKYGELWGKSKEDLLFESTQGAIKDAGITKDEIDASLINQKITKYFTSD